MKMLAKNDPKFLETFEQNQGFQSILSNTANLGSESDLFLIETFDLLSTLISMMGDKFTPKLLANKIP